MRSSSVPGPGNTATAAKRTTDIPVGDDVTSEGGSLRPSASACDKPSTRGLAAELCRASRLAQGLPAQILDRRALVDIAVLVPVEIDVPRCA